MSTNVNAVPYLAYGYGQPQTAVRNGIADANYTVTAADTIVALTTITAARTITLLSAASVPAGHQVIIKDESGSCSSGNTITVAGSIDGAGSYTLNSAYSFLWLYSTGTTWAKVTV